MITWLQYNHQYHHHRHRCHDNKHLTQGIASLAFGLFTGLEADLIGIHIKIVKTLIVRIIIIIIFLIIMIIANWYRHQHCQSNHCQSHHNTIPLLPSPEQLYDNFVDIF